MSRLADVQTFIDCSRRAGSAGELDLLMQEISREMGFDHFALMHHVDLRPFGPIDGPVLNREFIALSNYPQFWIDHYVATEIVNHDPVLLASQRTNVGFGWGQLPELITLSPQHVEILERSRHAGIADGFTVPANVPGEHNGSCNFAVRTGREAPSANFSMAQLIGSFAFQAARLLVARERLPGRDGPAGLTPRQLECIVLAARGKTDWEIAQILGIGEETVKQHFADARARYKVPKRMQVVLRAIYDGHVALSEVLGQR